MPFDPSQHHADLQADFNRDGYVHIDPLYGTEEVREIVENLDRFIRNKVPNIPESQVYYEDRHDANSLKQIQKIFEYDEWFRDLMLTGPARRIAEDVLQDEVVPVNMQYFNKPAGIGQPTPPHQDGVFFHLDPCEAVTGWLALEDVDYENGCIHYLRGSHKAGFRDHGQSGVLGFSQGMRDFGTPEDEAATVSFPGQAGTFLMHHAKTVHWAGANTSKTRSRRALGFIYYAKRAKEDVASKRAYQQALDARLKMSEKI